MQPSAQLHGALSCTPPQADQKMLRGVTANGQGEVSRRGERNNWWHKQRTQIPPPDDEGQDGKK